MCELCLFPIFLENDLLKVDKILGFLSVIVTEFCSRWIVYNQQKIVYHTLLGRGVYSEFFPARRGFHCISPTVKVNAPGIPQLVGRQPRPQAAFSLALERARENGPGD